MEHLPVFRLHARARDGPHKGEARSTDAKKLHGKGTTYKRTLGLLDRIGPVGRFGEKQYKGVDICFVVMVNIYLKQSLNTKKKLQSPSSANVKS